jgi:hypothetical protein
VVDGQVSLGGDGSGENLIAQMLTDKDTKYPLFIDPSIGWGRSQWTMVSSKFPSRWKFSGHEGMGLCPSGLSAACGGSGIRKRLFFEFGRDALDGKIVLDATFRVEEVYSSGCNRAWVDLELVSSGISKGTSWPGPKSVDQMGDRLVAFGRGAACDPDLPASPVEFHDNLTGDDAEPDENLTKTLAKFANGSKKRLTFMLRAKNEKSQYAWKRFKNNANLQVVYASSPKVPSSVGVTTGKRGKVHCATTSGNPTMVTVPSPMIKAKVRVQDHAASDPADKLRAVFTVQQYQDGTWTTVSSPVAPSSGGVAHGSVQSVSVPESLFVEGGRYRLKALTRSVWTFDGKADKKDSAKSKNWCYYTMNTQAPSPPTVTSVSPYRECVAEDCVAAGGPGQSGTFRVSPGTVKVSSATKQELDVVGYSWRLSGSCGVEVDPAECDLAGQGAVTVSAGASATITVTPPGSGVYLLDVAAKDSAGQTGEPEELMFTVAPAAGPAGYWSFVQESAQRTVADTSGAASGPGLVLGGPAGLDPRGRRGNLSAGQVPDQALGLDGAAGFAQAAGPVLGTGTSFTVSAWAWLGSAEKNATVVSQAAIDEVAAGWDLSYSASSGGWVFSWHWWDAAAGKVQDLQSVADAELLAPKTWTYLAGVYQAGVPGDVADDTIQLFVNGRAQGDPVSLASANLVQPQLGAMQVGRVSVRPGAFIDYFPGLVDEVQVWNRASTAGEIAQDAVLDIAEVGPAIALVADWDVNRGVASGVGQVPDSSGFEREPMVLSGGARIARLDDLVAVADDGTQGELTEEGEAAADTDVDASVDTSQDSTMDAGGELGVVLDGASGAVSTAGPVVDETGSFTVSVDVAVDPDRLAGKPVGFRAQVVGQPHGQAGAESSWAIWLQRHADGDGWRWHFGRSAVDATGKVISVVEEISSDPVELTTEPVQLTGAFDAWDGSVHLFEGSVEQFGWDEEMPALTGAQQGTGEVWVGRSRRNGAWGDYLPGVIQRVRVWTGAMTEPQVEGLVHAVSTSLTLDEVVS